MKRIVISLAACACLVFVICFYFFIGGRSREVLIPVAVRLEKDSPVVNGKLTVSNCQLNGEDIDDNAPIRVGPGEAIKLTGRFSPGNWLPCRLLSVWHTAEGDPPASTKIYAEAGGGMAFPIPIRVVIHEDDNTGKRLGLVDGAFVDARRLVTGQPDHEFRSKFKAPTRIGKYVLDINVEDPTVNYRKRGEPLTKIEGFAIWRREIWVE